MGEGLSASRGPCRLRFAFSSTANPSRIRFKCPQDAACRGVQEDARDRHSRRAGSGECRRHRRCRIRHSPRHRCANGCPEPICACRSASRGCADTGRTSNTGGTAGPCGGCGHAAGRHTDTGGPRTRRSCCGCPDRPSARAGAGPGAPSGRDTARPSGRRRTPGSRRDFAAAGSPSSGGGSRCAATGPASCRATCAGGRTSGTRAWGGVIDSADL